jgi:hypothetical protein
MRVRGDLLQGVRILLNAPKDIVEAGLPTIIERRRGGIGAGEVIPCGLVRKIECGIFGDHFVICSREPRVLVGDIGFGADESLNAGMAEEAVDVIVMAEESLGMLPSSRCRRNFVEIVWSFSTNV